MIRLVAIRPWESDAGHHQFLNGEMDLEICQQALARLCGLVQLSLEDLGTKSVEFLPDPFILMLHFSATGKVR